MRKPDTIFWMASAISAVAVALAVTVDDGWLLLMVGAYLLRPTLLAMGLFPALADEREMLNQYRAGNAAFGVLALGVVALTIAAMGGTPLDSGFLIAVLLLALMTRALTRLVLDGDAMIIGPRILLAIGGFLALFGFLEGGEPGALLSHVVPGASIIVLGVAARRWPRAAGAIVLVIVAALLWQFIGTSVSAGRPLPTGTAMAMTLILIPAVVAGAVLLRAPAREPGSDSAPTGTGTSAGVALLVVAALAAASSAVPDSVGAQPPSADPRFECKSRKNAAFGTDCRLTKSDTVYGRQLPGGAVLHYDSAGVYVFYSLYRNETVGGLELAGGHDGISQEVYPDGAAQALWLARPQEIEGVPCRAFSILGELFQRTERAKFYPNGRFRSCRSAQDTTIQGRLIKKGRNVEFDATGNVKSPG
ncbi:MAG: hypothetical protein FJ202_13370 [Gemmatimonadetes bacterium]|nr:hypothetical protein [Gemmatimonadota bacterium]